MLWLNLLIFLVLIAGNTEIMVTIVNRLYSLPIRCAHLRRMRQVCDAWMVSFPFLLLWRVGLSGPGVLVGGNWTDLPAGWAVYLAVCGFGAAGLAYSGVRWVQRAIPKLQLSNHSAVVDVAERLGYRPIARRPIRYRLMAQLPGNEILRVEVSEKVYRLPRLPESWDGLSILHLTDLHYLGTIQKPFFDEVMELSAELRPDLIVFTGDLLDNQSLIEWVPSTLGRLEAPLGRYFILGNHDWYLDHKAIRRAMREVGWHDVAGKTHRIEHNGHVLEIGGTERPWMGTHPDFSPDRRDTFRLLLSHTPDHIAWAQKAGVDLMLSGHNHGGQVVLPGIGPVYSPSRFGVRYAAGVFWKEPTLLYVSRGISGRHPFRWNCPPELTKIVLRIPESRDESPEREVSAQESRSRLRGRV